MKVLTAAQMREVDRRTIEMGIPGAVLMENAGSRVVEFLAERFALTVHHDTQEKQGFALVVAKNGPKRRCFSNPNWL